jgi:hypothetical protein
MRLPLRLKALRLTPLVCQARTDPLKRREQPTCPNACDIACRVTVVVFVRL